MELNFCTFNQKKFLRRFKKIYESSVFLGRFKITGKDKELLNNYEQMYKYLSSILKTPVIFENNNIYIVLAEIEGFLTAWDGFKETIDVYKRQLWTVAKSISPPYPVISMHLFL